MWDCGAGVWDCGVGVLECGSERVKEEGVVGLTPDRCAIMIILMHSFWSFIYL